VERPTAISSGRVASAVAKEFNLYNFYFCDIGASD
jgi:hypothetical protein